MTSDNVTTNDAATTDMVTVELQDGLYSQPLLKGVENIVKVREGARYRVVEKSAGEEKLLDNVMVKKSANDLVLEYGDGTQLIVEGYYTAGDVSVVLPADDAGVYELGTESAESAEGYELSDGTSIVYAHGDHDVLLSMAQGQGDLSVLLNDVPADGLGTLTYDAATADVDGGGGWFFKPAAALLVMGGVAMGSGGGGSKADPLTVVDVEVDPSTIRGIVTAGAVFNAEDFELTTYKADGSKLDTAVTVNNDGTFTVTLNEEYVGLFLLKLADTSDATNYLDEGTGEKKDLTVDLRAVGTIKSNGEEVIVNLSPVTELIVRHMLKDSGGDGDEAGVSLQGVEEAAAKVASDEILNIFGLKGSDGNALSVSSSNFRAVLEAISGAEQEGEGKSTDEVLDEVIAGISEEGVLDSKVFDSLRAGGRTADAQMLGEDNQNTGVSEVYIGLLSTVARVALISQLGAVSENANPALISKYQSAIAATTDFSAPPTVDEVRAVIDAVNEASAVASAQAAVLEDSSSPGGGSNADGVPVSAEQLDALVENVDPSLISEYQSAIAATTDFSDPPTVDEVQALIDAINVAAASAAAAILEDSSSPGGGNNADGIPVSAEQLDALAENVDPSLISEYQSAIAATTDFSDPPTVDEVQALIDAINVTAAASAAAAILEDSSSPGGGNNADGVPVSAEQLDALAENVDPSLISEYQSAIAAKSDFSNPPTVDEVQALIDGVNVTIASALAAVLEDSSSPGGGNNADGIPVSAEQLDALAENVDPSLISEYQSAIAAKTDFSDPPTVDQVQAVVNAVNDVAVTKSNLPAAKDQETIDVVNAPGIVSISADQTLVKDGDAIVFAVTLSAAVTVNTEGGTPSIMVTLNGETVTAIYAGLGEDGATLTFNTTAPGAGDGNVVQLMSFSLNGASILGNAMNLPLDTQGRPSMTALLVDNTASTISITSSATVLKAGETPILTFTLSELSTDFVAADITVIGGALGALTSTDNIIYTATFTPAAASTTAAAISVAAGVFSDAANNTNTVSNTLSMPVNTTVPTIAPTISISSSASALKAGETAILTFTLSELSTDFTATDISVAGGALGALTSTDNLVYTATFTPAAASTTAAAISVAAGVFSDAASNTNNVSNSLSMSVDTIVPSITTSNIDAAENGVAVGAVMTSDTDIPATGAYSLTGAGSDNAQFTIDADSGVLSFIAAKDFEAPDDTGGDGVYDLTVSVIDNAGNATEKAITVTLTELDTTVLTISITSSATALKAGETAILTFTLSEASTDFVAADISVAGGALGALTSTDNLVYTATFTPAAASTTAAAISVAAGVFSDAASNTNNVSNSLSMPVDTVVPSITTSNIDAAENGVVVGAVMTSDTDIPATGAYSLTGAGSDNAQFTIDADTGVLSFIAAKDFEAPDDTGGDGVYELTVSVSDHAGNASEKAITVTLTELDMIVPTISIVSSATALKVGETATIIFTLSEASTDFTADDISVSGGTLGVLTAISEILYVATFTKGAAIDSSVSVASGVFMDAAGNFNVDGADLNNTVSIELNGGPVEATGVTGDLDTHGQITSIGTSGEYVLSFQGGDLGGDNSVFVQAFNADGTFNGAQAKLEASGVTAGADESSQITSVGRSGEYVVTFQGVDLDGDKSVFVQAFNADGTFKGSQAKLEATGMTRGPDESPQITSVGTSGAYVVAFQGLDPSYNQNIFVQAFNVDGTVNGTQVELEATGVMDGNDIYAQITSVGMSGEYVLTFQGMDVDGDYSIFVQAFNADGSVKGAMVQMEAAGVTEGVDAYAQITSIGASGEYVVAFSGMDIDGDESIFVQAFNADGSFNGAQVKLEASGVTKGVDAYAQITSIGTSGEYVVAFHGENLDGGGSIFVQAFNADGSFNGTQVKLEATGVMGDVGFPPRITSVGTSGAYAVAFQEVDFNGDMNIFAQAFNADATVNGARVKLEGFGGVTGTYFYPQITSVGTSGEYVISFQGMDSGNDFSIFVQAFNADGTVNNGSFLVATGVDEGLFGTAHGDTFQWPVGQTGTDTVSGFSVGDSDKIDISGLLQGYTGTNLSDWVNYSFDGTDTTLVVDLDGAGAGSAIQTIIVSSVDLTATYSTLDDLLTGGALIL